MKLNKIFTTILAAVVLFVACEETKPENTSVTPRLSASPIEVTFSAAGSSSKIALTATLDWTVTSAPEWITVSPESGAGSLYKQDVTFTAAQNTAGARAGVVTFAIEGLTYDVKVKQANAFGADAPDAAIYFESFKTSQGSFTIKDVKLSGPVTKVWSHTADYKCMKATAYVNNSYYETESWLISPEIDLSAQTAAYFTFEHAGLYFGDITKEATVWASKDGVEWKQLEIATENYPTSWTFVSAGNLDLSEFVGGKVQFGFKFMSTTTKSGTWEVKNVAVVAGVADNEVIPDVDPTKTAWLELPAADNANLQYFSHRYKMNDEIHRNYSFAWSQKDLVSLWVAYPLCKTYMEKTVDRTDAWAYDPHLGKELSSAPFSYYAGDYDRGHQLPSADRLCCKAANQQTFYGTNIVPQLSSHNVGVWGDLEKYVRNEVASACDTVYVVTGAVVDGATEFSEDSDKKQITIPVAFFKALLRYQKGGDPEWATIGFYTVHEGNGGESIKSISMSVDELEKKVGFNLFVNLESKIGKDKADALEAQDPLTVGVWNLL